MKKAFSKIVKRRDTQEETKSETSSLEVVEEDDNDSYDWDKTYVYQSDDDEEEEEERAPSTDDWEPGMRRILELTVSLLASRFLNHRAHNLPL